MKKTNLFFKLLTIGLLVYSCNAVSCSEEEENKPNTQKNTTPSNNTNNSDNNSENNSGNNTNQNQNDVSKSYSNGYVEDDFSVIESDINLETMDLMNGSIFADKHLPISKDLSDQLPPIFDQGTTHTTCVACAVGYYGMSFLWGREQKLSKSQLALSSNQMSPKDLFMSIETSQKGKQPNGDCWGTNFDAAFQVLENRGIATLANCPYENFTDCDYDPNTYRSEAAKHKITTRRKINLNAKEIKSYLSMGKLVIFAANVGKQFNAYKGNAVFSLNAKDENSGGHAMAICGYDDNKGPNGAFKVINSWGTDWGDNGYMWVDQKFFCESKTFVKDVPIIMEGKAAELEVDKNNTIVNKVEGWDLVPQEFSYYDLDDPEYPEDSEDPTWIRVKYNAYNAGEKTIPASKEWCVALLYYNAYDASESGFFMIDLYSDRYGSKGDMCPNWLDFIPDYGDPEEIVGIHSEAYCWTNVDILGGQSIANAVYHNDKPFIWDIQIPSNLNGKYYLAFVMDPFNYITESNEANNYKYIMADNGEPLNFVNGVATNAPSNIKKRFAVGEDKLQKLKPNTYTTDELSALIAAQQKSGVLKQKALEYLKNSDRKKTCKNRTQEQ